LPNVGIHIAVSRPPVIFLHSFLKRLNFFFCETAMAYFPCTFIASQVDNNWQFPRRKNLSLHSAYQRARRQNRLIIITEQVDDFNI
jgi:hypothetical protein